MKAIFNHNLVDDLTLTVNDRGLQFGDGLFETIMVENMEVKHLDLHFDRLKRGVFALRMAFPEYFSISFFQSQIAKLLNANQKRSAVINIQVWRKPGGTYKPTSQEVNFMIRMRGYSSAPPQVLKKVAFSETVQNFPSIYASFKTCNALKYVMAGMEQTEKAANDLIILDFQGNISETINKNLFWKIDNAYYTPGLECGCIEGIMRKVVIDHLKKQGIAIHEVKENKAAIFKSSRVFACNASGIYPIAEIEGNQFETDPDELNQLPN